MWLKAGINTHCFYLHSMLSTPSSSPSTKPIKVDHATFDWREYYYAIKARSWIVVLCLMLSIFYGVFTAATQKIKYSARAVLFIEQAKSNVLSIKVEEVHDDQIKSVDMINTVVDTLQSYHFALLVVNRQKLAQDAEFLAAAGISRSQASPEQAAASLVRMVKSSYRLTTRLIDIFVTTRNPNLSVRLANAYPEEYFHYLNDKRLESSRSASSFLMEEADHLRKKMRASEEAMQNFRERERAASFESMLQEAQTQITELAARQNLIQSKLIQINGDLEVAKANQGNTQELLRLPSVVGDNKISARVSHLAQLEKDFVMVKQRYRDKHPLFISIKTQIDLENQGLNRELADVVGLLDGMRVSLLAQQSAARTEREASEKRLLDVTSKSIEYNDLKRELESDGALYNAVVGRIKEVDVTKELANTPIQLHEAAVGAQQVGSSPFTILIKSILTGLAIGIGIIIGLHKLDSSLKTVDEIESFTNLSVVAAIPRIGVASSKMLGLFSKEQFILLKTALKQSSGILFTSKYPIHERVDHATDILRPVLSMFGNPNVIAPLPQGSELVVKDDRSGVVAEAFRSLRASIATNAYVENQRTFLITSACPSEGKSFCSANFSTTLAHQGLKTLLIDADLRKPSISRLFFGMHRKPGLSEVLLGTCTMAEALQSTQIEGLSVMTAGGRSSNPSELLPGQPFRDLLKEALTQFDRIVIDSAPLLAVSDTILIAPHVDVLCLVVRSFMTPRKMVARALKTLSETHVKPAGIVFNYLPSAGSYSYYYSGTYYGSYGSKGVYGS